MADGTVRASGLNLRKGIKPGEVVKVLRRSSRVEILGEETWLRVRTRDGLEGYAFGDFIDVDAPAAPPELDEFLSLDCVIERYHHDRFIGKALFADHDFFPFLDQIADLADQSSLSVYVTSSTRDPDGQISSAIVEPAKRSNHNVGHAIDMNLQTDSGQFFNSSKLKKLDQQPQAVQRFIQEIRDDPILRWGGDFSTPDVVHIDDGLNLRHPDIYDAKLESRLG